ncbi:LytTR family DNA-binding domain-containing protein [Bacillus cereus]|uniref:LytTR family DNA-binding domain-containing protein n=1 Tax=Bacillus cereus TaxID=1396 RepID=UPI001F2F454E|nr:LytTR family DNA-binding domain-containing protein [Bacillus cereus]MCE7037035.1 LytTR family transcriptional regulator DNA-binding domain-containing protein [Bacillus cereus]BCC46443.1 transcriptional regulatory protein [Bacillus cereus]HDR4615765.1 LytTR family transcriptional regulator DNA-binding domain-containing protein [Bacillus cereus]HDR4621598.1 LytTR family transcriptional regulator DNA-binding domain-containing protein [Bacillus cereus]
MEDKTLGLLLDVVGELFSDEISIAVSNTEEYMYYRPSKRIDLKISAGDPIKEGTIAHKAMVTRQKASEFINRDVFGIPYHGMAVPFLNNGKIEGCVTAIYPALTDGKSVVTLKTTDGWVPVPFSKVKYLEAKDKKTYVNSEELTGTHKYSLQEFEYLLPKDSFIRCHRSFIVNVNHIKAIYPDTHSTFVLSMDNGERVPVSQSYASYFRKLLGF